MPGAKPIASATLAVKYLLTPQLRAYANIPAKTLLIATIWKTVMTSCEFQMSFSIFVCRWYIDGWISFMIPVVAMLQHSSASLLKIPGNRIAKNKNDGNETMRKYAMNDRTGFGQMRGRTSCRAFQRPVRFDETIKPVNNPTSSASVNCARSWKMLSRVSWTTLSNSQMKSTTCGSFDKSKSNLCEFCSRHF